MKNRITVYTQKKYPHQSDGDIKNHPFEKCGRFMVMGLVEISLPEIALDIREYMLCKQLLGTYS